MTFVRLLYVSKPPAGYDRLGLEILFAPVRAAALTLNPKRGLTGAMLYSERGIAQALEGPAGQVDALYARIQTDPRHHDVQLVERCEISERMFSEFAMAFLPAPRDPSVFQASAPDLLRALQRGCAEHKSARAAPGQGMFWAAPKTALKIG